MSCCGRKREQLMRRPAVPPAAGAATPEPARPARAPRVFEYTGGPSLTVRGVVSGRTYSFPHSGACVEIIYEDSFAMLAERDLRMKGSG